MNANDKVTSFGLQSSVKTFMKPAKLCLLYTSPSPRD